MPDSIGIATHTLYPFGKTVLFAFIYMLRGMVPCSDVSQELMEFNIVVLDAQLLDTANFGRSCSPCHIRSRGVGEICTFQRCGALPSSGNLAQSHCNCPGNVQHSATTTRHVNIDRHAMNPLIHSALKMLSTSMSTCSRNMRDLGKGIAYFDFSEEMTLQKQSGQLSYEPR